MSYHVNKVQRPMRAAFAEERAEGRCSMAKIQLLVRATVTILRTRNRGKVRVLVFCRKIKHRAYAPWGVGV